jgi:hypothetical protein
MRQLRQMLRLHHDGVSAREIGRTLGVARTTIQDNLKRAAASGLTWPLPPELSDDELEQRLFAHTAIKSGQRRRSEPDWAALAREPKRPGVNVARQSGWESVLPQSGMLPSRSVVASFKCSPTLPSGKPLPFGERWPANPPSDRLRGRRPAKFPPQTLQLGPS